MRSLRWGRGAAVFVEVKPGELVEAEVLVYDGERPVRVRFLQTRLEDDVAYASLSIRPIAPQPPPGAGGRDVPPLRFGDRKAPGPDHVEPYRWRGWRSGPGRK